MFRYIVGMSEAKSKIHDQIASVAYELDRHLLKLILYPGTAHQSHWSKEIAGFLNHVPKMKGSNKYPSSRFIYDAISIYEDSLADMKRTLVKDYNDLGDHGVIKRTDLIACKQMALNTHTVPHWKMQCSYHSGCLCIDPALHCMNIDDNIIL